MGPHHARVLGWAKSFTKALDQETMTSHDEDAVGAILIVWSLIQSVMPCDVLDCVDNNLVEMKLPCLAMHNIEEGKVSNLYFCIQTYILLGHGFHIRLGNQIYEFPTAEHAPPEAYLSYGYQAYIFIFILKKIFN